MPLTLSEQIRGSLSASREEVERIIAGAEEEAHVVNTRAAGVERALAESQLARLAELRSELERNRKQIGARYAMLAETLATVSVRLVEAARNADFTAPPWPGGIGRTVEIKLAETREVTLRFTSGVPTSGASASRIPGR